MKSARRTTRDVFLDALLDPVGWFVICALAVTLFAKTRWWLSVDSPVDWAGLVSADLLVLGLAWALMNLARRAVARLWFASVAMLVAFLLYVLAFFDALSIAGTGIPLYWQGLAVALSRWSDVVSAGSAELGPTIARFWWLGLVVPLVIVPVMVWRTARRSSALRPPLVPAVAIALAGLVSSWISATPLPPQGQGQSVLVRLVRQLVAGSDTVSLPAVGAEPDADAVVTVVPPGSAARPPDVVLVILESVGFAASGIGRPDSPMPFLNELARLGRSFTNVQTAVPHTSKALTAILCGSYPSRNSAIVESADNYPLRCLPHYLSQAGYRTLFIQSADGTFEQRPRLVEAMGFEEFVAWQDFGPEVARLGYLASDDGAMMPYLGEWLSSSDVPAFVVVLTSVTHHPYVMPPTQPEASEVNALAPAQRYRRLLSWTDAWIAHLIRRLRDDGHLDQAALIVVGDHGESFDPRDGLGHSNVFSERVLRVPALVVGPGIPPGRDHVRRHLVDIVPTVLELTGVQLVAPPIGFSLFATPPADRILLSNSWFSDQWIAACTQEWKVVVFSETDLTLVQDLRDPQSDRELPRGELERLMGAISSRLESSIIDEDSVSMPDRTFFDGAWGCDREVCWWTETGVGMNVPSLTPTRPEPTSGRAFDPVFESNRAVAHALGGIDGVDYSNSLDAFERSMERGFRLVEVDLSFDTDGELICFHEGSDDQLSGATADSGLIRDRIFADRFAVPTASALLERLVEHPEALLVTDTKGDNVAVLGALVELARQIDPALVDRIIPQVYHRDEIETVRRIGPFPRVILTLYQMTDVSDADVIALVDELGVGAVTMPMQRLNRDLSSGLAQVGALVYVHTVNAPEIVRYAVSLGAHGIYTDTDTSLLRTD